MFRACVWHLIRWVLYPYFRVRGRGAHHLETPGPLVLAPVHRSNLDSLMVAVQTKRMVYALGKESLFSPSALGWVMAALGAFPVNRGAADREALRSAQMLLESGAAVLVFPEGTRQTGETVGEVFDGAGFLAARTGARVVPVGVAGTEASLPPGARFPRRTRVAVVTGAPLDPPTSPTGRVSTKARRAFTERLALELQEVFDEARAEAEPI
jgi:1-acyl-sn-glycerol-3-phosphate acyltransferase